MSTPSVNPKNWKSGGATLLKKNWQIQYYFYSANNEKRKLVAIKGMNEFNNLEDRRAITQGLIEDEIENNKSGYNPFTKTFVSPVDINADLHPYLDFISAFRIAASKIRCTKKHRKELGICINRLEKKVAKLGLRKVVIEQLTRRQLKQLLESCNLPDNYFNKYLSFLSSLFGELVEYECCEHNIVRDIRKRKIIKKQREILSSEHHKAVMKHLYVNHYEFWRYARIFLFSGARTTELFRVQAKDVDIENQEYNTTIAKGSNPHEVTKVILKEVIPLWNELLENTKPNSYLFSKGLKPGIKPISSSQITRRWSRLVKKSDDIKDDDGNMPTSRLHKHI
ncbi:tyrosine-type recombinase/integrase [Aequorivita sp. CIP111184]|uniref:tyrosine-type recombinase/integrase n=1 Tax=Aequorivita sp. CIP111184 TaxID=2211356 RepID=UPI0015EC46A8|nr:tyrosine-type recombinase/integrase [Aequorivita sp. CIP111184]